jgi:xylulokinase
VGKHEPDIFEQIDQVMLPGDYLAMQFTGELTTTISALSEGIFWDFRKNRLSKDVMHCYGFDHSIIPPVRPVFSVHGNCSRSVAETLSLTPGIPVTYKAGDQPNNALSLNVLEPGEVAATAGTSGVIYGVSDELTYDPKSRVNTFAHVNYTEEETRTGVLLCINGTGILNSWARKNLGGGLDYVSMNEAAAGIPIGSNGLTVLPFGNGAERMLENMTIGAQISNLDLNQHTTAHLFRAVQEGIACAFRYGLDIMRENGMSPRVIRAGRSNMFLSPLFTEAFVNTTGVPVELYAGDGSVGAALGAGIGAGVYKEPKEAFSHMRLLGVVEPQMEEAYKGVYATWQEVLEKQIAGL